MPTKKSVISRKRLNAPATLRKAAKPGESVKKSKKTASSTTSSESLTSKPGRKMEEQLARYQSMRDFNVTDEPSGKSKDRGRHKGKLPFVIQKHAASHLHYDFRLGWDGVLKSWACVKGPSYYPGDRRLAVQVEDHPLEYGGFEGTIPKGQYGGGTVMLWDRGTWAPQADYADVTAALLSGSLKFTMYGKKIKGNWTLVRMGGKTTDSKKPNWLLIKEHDAFERSKNAKPITEEAPNSVSSGRDLEQIAAHENRHKSGRVI